LSTQFAQEQLVSHRLDARRSVECAKGQDDRALALLALEDVNVASRSSARLLITASTQQAVETLARRIHASGPRAQSPFVMISAGELPVGAQALRDGCVRFLEGAAGGSVLVSEVEEMPADVQEELLDLLAGLDSARRPSGARLIAGTTVSLLDRVAAGTFSERLFYRLNTIHFMAG
jgi:two-component system response regulator PilR (NtrC family)